LTALALVIGMTVAPEPVQAAAVPSPIRAAFYYPWFPETENWASHWTPALAKYNSSNRTVLAAHVAQARYAGLDAFISSYWGRTSLTGARLPLLLDAARAQGFRVAAYYEPESLTTPPSPSQLAADLDALYALTTDVAWLRVNSKPVLFVYNTGARGSCTEVSRLLNAGAGRFYLDLKVFSGYRTCASQPDSWHQYGPAVRYDQQDLYSATVSPGFWKFNEASSRLPRDPDAFSTALNRQVASGAKWQLVTSFNEWGEGTSVEPAVEWQSTSGQGNFLDAMSHAYH
jgi:hypothetical protein